MKVPELEELARRLDWKLMTPTFRQGSSDVQRLDQLEDGTWRTGYRERGTDEWDAGSHTEEEAVDIVFQRLKKYFPREGLE